MYIRSFSNLCLKLSTQPNETKTIHFKNSFKLFSFSQNRTLKRFCCFNQSQLVSAVYAKLLSMLSIELKSTNIEIICVTVLVSVKRI